MSENVVNLSLKIIKKPFGLAKRVKETKAFLENPNIRQEKLGMSHLTVKKLMETLGNPF